MKPVDLVPKVSKDRSLAWEVMHWAVAISPFLLVLALSIWGFGKYVWIPFVAAILCPLGMVLTGWKLKSDRNREKAR